MDWTYHGAAVTDEEAESHLGFVYLITNVVTGRMYVGKKLFTRAKTLKPLKGKTRKRRSRVASDWRDYWGSSKELQQDVERVGPDQFTREVLHFCETRGELSYMELTEQVIRDVLRKPEKYYNAYVGARISRKHLQQK